MFAGQKRVSTQNIRQTPWLEIQTEPENKDIDPEWKSHWIEQKEDHTSIIQFQFCRS